MTNNESGNALIFAVTISALALIILLLITRVVDNQLNLASAFAYKVKTGTEKQNLLADSLQGNNNSANRTEMDTPYASKIVKIYDDSDELFSIIQSMRSNGTFLLPNWGIIRQKLPSLTCPPATKAPLNGSVRACEFQDLTIDHSAVFIGNVKAKKLILNNVSDSKFVFAVIGNLELEEIALNNLKNTVLEIISAGEIKINETTTEGTEDSFVFMLSAIGNIVVNSTADVCDLGSDNKSGVKLQLNAENIVLNNKQLDSQVYGCKYDGSEYIGGTAMVGLSPNLSW